jgi:hypothetical protein
MKTFFISLFIFTLSLPALADSGVRGQVHTVSGCSERKVMVWLSLDKDNYQERLLLMHTEVPIGGSFQFYLVPGDYQLRASDDQGCEFLQKISIKNGVEQALVRMVKK